MYWFSIFVVSCTYTDDLLQLPQPMLGLQKILDTFSDYDQRCLIIFNAKMIVCLAVGWGGCVNSIVVVYKYIIGVAIPLSDKFKCLNSNIHSCRHFAVNYIGLMQEIDSVLLSCNDVLNRCFYMRTCTISIFCDKFPSMKIC